MAAATTLLTFTPVINSHSILRGNKNRIFTSSRLFFSSRANFETIATRKDFINFDRKISKSFCFSASLDDSTHPDIKVEKEDETEANEAQEQWKQMLEAFKKEALRIKGISVEAYEVYSKQAMVKLKETSETLKIQADKAREDLSVVAKQIREEGKVYLSKAAETSPDSVKDVAETFASSTDDLKEMSAVRDFYLGIPYGAFLSIGGFLWFMLTGSVHAVRFGVILGGALLALSVASLRSFKSGQSSELFLKGQAAIAALIFIREWRLFCQRRLFSTSLMILISGGMLAFYAYRIMIDGSSSKNPSSDHGSED